MTSTDEREIRAVIEHYTAAWSRGDLTTVFACYHEDFVLHYFGDHPLAGKHVGKTAALNALSEFSRRTRRQLLSIVGVLAGPNRGAIVVREAMGVDRREVERVLVYTVAGGLLRECWVYDQDQPFISQLIRAGNNAG